MINKLVSKIQKTNAPIVVGLDPMLNYVPEHVQKKDGRFTNEMKQGLLIVVSGPAGSGKGTVNFL